MSKIHKILMACSLCGTPGTNKSSCPLNKESKNPIPNKHDVYNKHDIPQVQNGGAKAKGPNRKFKIDVTMETPTVLGVFDLYDNTVNEPTWHKNPKPYKTINPSQCAKEVVKWYKSVMTARGGPVPDTGYYYADFIGNFDIKHVKGNVFEVSYVVLNYYVDPATGKVNPDTVTPWEIADPDYNYLYPLSCQGTKYHVYATVHGSKSKTPPRQKRSEHPLFRGPYNKAAKLWK
jgi:hypothetical protein